MYGEMHEGKLYKVILI